jgi:hypothetical protein
MGGYRLRSSDDILRFRSAGERNLEVGHRLVKVNDMNSRVADVISQIAA